MSKLKTEVKLFGPSDFEKFGYDAAENNEMAKRANEILQKWISEQRDIYSANANGEWSTVLNYEPKNYTGKLVFIEKIEEKCSHGEIYRESGKIIYRCGHCHKRVKPVGGWEVSE